MGNSQSSRAKREKFGFRPYQKLTSDKTGDPTDPPASPSVASHPDADPRPQDVKPRRRSPPPCEAGRHRLSVIVEMQEAEPFAGLVGFACQAGDKEYSTAASVTSTTGGDPVYWMEEYQTITFRDNEDANISDEVALLATKPARSSNLKRKIRKEYNATMAKLDEMDLEKRTEEKAKLQKELDEKLEEFEGGALLQAAPRAASDSECKADDEEQNEHMIKERQPEARQVGDNEEKKWKRESVIDAFDMEKYKQEMDEAVKRALGPVFVEEKRNPEDTARRDSAMAQYRKDMNHAVERALEPTLEDLEDIMKGFGLGK